MTNINASNELLNHVCKNNDQSIVAIKYPNKIPKIKT